MARERERERERESGNFMLAARFDENYDDDLEQLFNGYYRYSTEGTIYPTPPPGQDMTQGQFF